MKGIAFILFYLLNTRYMLLGTQCFFSLTRVVELEEQIKREKDQADLLLEQQRLVWQSNNLC